MTVPKIVTMTKSCSACPYRRGHDCEAAGVRITNLDEVAPFCPLADFPSQKIADQELTIRFLRDPHQWGIHLALLTHVAAKLKLNLGAGRVTSVIIPYKRGGEEYEARLTSDSITGIEVPEGYAIVFFDRGQRFKLLPDTSPPVLRLESKEPELLGHWEPLTLLI